MSPSTPDLQDLLSELTGSARRRGWTDAEWARRSGLPKETLCRLRARSSCDFATLAALARAAGATIDVQESAARATPDGLWPVRVDRAYESRLLDVAATRSTRAEDWRSLGPPFFVAGIAVTLASVGGFDRPACLALAEALHPGATEPRVYGQWLERTPLSPSRFLPMLAQRMRDAA